MKKSGNIDEVAAQFKCSADVGSLKPYGSGHINDTFFLKNSNGSGPDYLLQRINHHIFTNVDKLMDNMQLVTQHLKSKIIQQGGDPLKEVMTLIPTHEGDWYYRDSEGDYWRMFYFLNDTRSYDLVTTDKQAYEGGKAFGRFQAMLADMPAEQMFEVIPNFHNLQARLQQLKDAVTNNAAGRVASVQTELKAINSYADELLYFQHAQNVAALPVRVIHNDTKFNNVLLDSNDEAQCVIDLETVMAGYVAYDFGDAIRSIINTAAEDEADLSRIKLNTPLFDAYTRGYLSTAGSFLTDAEVTSLIKGVLLMPYMQTVRFLTDYLNGDVYYKTKFDGHNLQRARAQWQLFKLLYVSAADLQQTILSELNSYKTVPANG